MKYSSKYQSTLRLRFAPLVGVLLVAFIFLAIGVLNWFMNFPTKSVYTKGKPIGNSCYKVYENSVYATFKRKGEFTTYIAKKLDANVDTFTAYPNIYCAGHDENSVFIAQVKIPEADINTFKEIQINNLNHIFADKKQLYVAKYYPEEIKDKTYITILHEDPNITKVTGNFGYIIGSNNVYYQGQVLSDLNPSTTKYIEIPGIARGTIGKFVLDYKNKLLYCEDKKITDLDINNLAKYTYTFVRKEKYPNVSNSETWYLIGDGKVFYTSTCEKLSGYSYVPKDGKFVKLGAVR